MENQTVSVEIQFEQLKNQLAKAVQSKIANSGLAIDCIRMYLMGHSQVSILKFLGEKGVHITNEGVFTAFKKKYIEPLSPELRAFILNAGMKAPDVDPLAESTAGVIKRIMKSVALRIWSVQEGFKDKTTVGKEDEIFIKLCDQYNKLRKDLETELIESEVEKARRDGIEKVAILALKFIPTQEGQRAFAEEVGKLEQAINS